MTDWGTYIDRQIRKAMADGEFNDLPGEGKPLNLDEDMHTPNEMRLAYKILRDNELAPDWIMAGKDLDGKIEDWMSTLRRARRAYRNVMDAPNSGAGVRAHAEESWKAAQAKLTGSAAKLNREINTYNLKVPAGVSHKLLLNTQHEIDRLTEGG